MEKKTDECCSPEMMQALSDFGKMLSIASIYGMNHPSVATPLQDAHHSLFEALEQDEMVMLGLFNKTLTINDKMLTEYTVHLRALERRFIALEVPHLVFRKGMSQEELGQLIDALCSTGGAAGATLKERLDEANLDHIKADQVQYVAQHEGQRLVGDGEGAGAEGTGAGAGESGAGEGAGAEETGGETGEEEKEPVEEKEEPEPTINVEQIVAFLKGSPGATDTPSDELQELVADPQKLGQLIMESVDVRQSAQSIGQGESLADIVIGCLRKTYDGLAQQKKYSSTRGKASLHKAMLLLEKTVVDKIRNAVGEEQPEVDAQILEALREAEEQRQVEILAARFVEQQKKITKVEMDILRYVREYGEEKARQMLSSSEIPEEEWNRLMIQNRRSGGSGDGEGGGEGGGGPGGGSGDGEGLDMGALAIVLDKLEDIMELDNVPPEIVEHALNEVRETVKETTAQATKRVESLEEQVQQHEEDTGKPPKERRNKKNRADLLEEIANLALTLAQPLTVITVSIESARQESLPADMRNDMLEMAHESAERMKELMKRLTRLVGYPSMKVADAGIDE